MVQQHVGRAGGVGAGEVADDGIETIGGLDRSRFEPAVEHVARALHEQRKQVTALLDAQTGESSALPQAAPQRARQRAHVGRGLQRQLAQHVGHALQHVLIHRQLPGVARRELGHFGLGARQAAAEFEEVRVVQRQEVGNRPLKDAQTQVVQAHVGDHFGGEQADGVARDRVAKPRVEFFRHRGTAHDAAALDERDLEAGAREIERAHQPVVAGADEDGGFLRQLSPRRTPGSTVCAAPSRLTAPHDRDGWIPACAGMTRGTRHQIGSVRCSSQASASPLTRPRSRARTVA